MIPAAMHKSTFGTNLRVAESSGTSALGGRPAVGVSSVDRRKLTRIGTAVSAPLPLFVLRSA